MRKDKLKTFSNLFVTLLVLTSLISYPSSLQLFFPAALRLLVVFSFFITAIYAFIYLNRNYDYLNNFYLKLFFIFWGGYFVCLTISTFVTGYDLRIYNYLSYLSKMIFFIFCLNYLGYFSIKKALIAYSYLVLIITVFSIIIGTLVAFDLITYNYNISLQLPEYLKFYYLVFYAQSSPLEFFNFPLYRLQGYSIEAGIFALSLILPSLYFLIIEKCYLKFSIIIFGIIWTFSFPVFAFYLLFSIISFYSRRRALVRPLFLTFITILIVVMTLEYFEQGRMIEKKEIANLSDSNELDIGQYKTFTELRARSWKDRTNAIADYKVYMDTHLNLAQKLFGIGAGNAIYGYGKTIANGFLFRFIDAGFIGFIFYFLSAFVLLVYSLKIALDKNSCGFTYVLALTSMSLILVSIFRHSYDLSYWQMFIYASMFCLSGEGFKSNDLMKNST